MLLDSVDIEVLRFAGTYGLLSPRDLQCLGFSDTYAPPVEQLLRHCLLERCGPGGSEKYLRLSAQGESFLKEREVPCERYVGQSLKEAEVRRVIETARVALLCRRAGIETAQDDCSALVNEPAFVSSKPLRRALHNSVSSAVQCAGFGHWGGMAYMVYYATEVGYGPYFQHENTLIHRLCPYYGQGFDMPFSILAAGDTYAEVYRLLKLPPPPRRRRNGQITYAEAWHKTRRPFHIGAFTETGAVQLALMRVPNHRRQIARLILGDAWGPPAPELSDSDGMDGGVPFIVGVDMDLRRITGLCQKAWAAGYPCVKVAAMTEQVDEVLAKALPLDGIELLYFDIPDLARAFGQDLLYLPQHQEARAPDGRPFLV